MIQNKHIVSSLPLLAAVLGRTYGVEVRIGGQTAYTNGRIIQLPDLPLDGDETLLNLVRGYIDHESAHLRATDFAALNAAGLSPLGLHVWNILEDWRVEQKLAGVFPGCRANFLWLIRHLFLNADTAKQAEHNDPAVEIINWLLFSVRAWDVPEVARERDASARIVEQAFPNILPQLNTLLRNAPTRLTDTAETIRLAREIVAVLRTYLNDHDAQRNAKAGAAPVAGKPNSSMGSPDDTPVDALQRLLRNGSGLPGDLGSILRESLSALPAGTNGKLRVAVTGTKSCRRLLPDAEHKARSATTALRTRLQAHLQSKRLTHHACGRRGRLAGRLLHRVFVDDPRVFQRKIEQQGLDTFVQILLDASGSMSGRFMELAGQACFAVASALAPISGVTSAVGVFPGEPTPADAGGDRPVSVAPILGAMERLHNRFSMDASGGTPMAEALWWALQQLRFRRENRKIILLISDGEPDDVGAAQAAIRAVRAEGCEIYGIGIETASLSRLLPAHSRSIGNIAELPQSMFDVLGESLLRNQSN